MDRIFKERLIQIVDAKLEPEGRIFGWIVVRNYLSCERQWWKLYDKLAFFKCLWKSD